MPNERLTANLRRLRAGIVGGSRSAFIGSVHRVAVELDGQAHWSRARLSSHPEIARESADQGGIDFVIIATPNHLHYPGGASLPRRRHPVAAGPSNWLLSPLLIKRSPAEYALAFPLDAP